MTERDVLWADLVQFDPPSADKVWDGDLRDPDAPGWYTHLGSLIHRARGPAELDELADEPDVVATMRRAGLGAAIVALPRHRGVRSVGRVVAVKAAAAATTVSMVGVAAAATTGIVATVAATVVVPAIQERVRPVIETHIVPVEPTQHADVDAVARPSPGRGGVPAPGGRLRRPVGAGRGERPARAARRSGAGVGGAGHGAGGEHDRSGIDGAADHGHRHPRRRGARRARAGGACTRRADLRAHTRRARTRRAAPVEPTTKAHPPGRTGRACVGRDAGHGCRGDVRLTRRRPRFPSTHSSASAHREFRA